MTTAPTLVQLANPKTLPPGGRYELFEILRRTYGPIYYDAPLNMYVALGYKEASSLLRRSGRDGLSSAVIKPSQRGSGVFALVANMMIANDDLTWKGMRQPVKDFFTRPVVDAEWTDPIRSLTRQTLQPLRRRGQMNYGRDFAGVLPVRVISKMMGFPDRDFLKLKRWSDAIAPAATNPYMIDPAMRERAELAIEEFRQYLNQRVAFERNKELHHHKMNPIMKAMIAALDSGELTEDTFLANATLLFIAGHETTTRLLCGMTALFLEHPKQLEQIRKNPALIPSAVQEALRKVSPFQIQQRWTTQEIRDRNGLYVLPTKVDVAVVTAAANHDRGVFVNPEDFWIERFFERDAATILTFGAGGHYCLGAEIARLEAEAALAEWLTMPEVTEIGERGDLEDGNSTLFHGYVLLDLEYAAHGFEPFGPRASAGNGVTLEHTFAAAP